MSKSPAFDLNDEELVEIVRSRERELYGEIIRRYQNKLGRYLKKFIYDQDEVEDVLQTVFIKAYQNLHGFNTHKKFSSWIYRIAHNQAVNHLKKNSRGQISLNEVEYKIVDEKINLNAQADRILLKQQMEKVLSSLKLKYREPLVLFYFEQKSYQEISDILRLPMGTVGTLIRRGKKILKKNLKIQK